MFKRVITFGCALAVAGTFVAAQSKRPASPAAKASTQIGDKWIDVSYGAPIKRGRTTLWGTGAEYGKTLLAGGPIWRAGANVSTQLHTETPLQIGGKMVPAGTYTMFIDLKSPTDWTLVLSSWPAQEQYDPANKAALWGGFGYTSDKDVARVAMKVDKLPLAVDQLAWNFADVTSSGGKLVIMWDTNIATAPFTVAK